MIWKPHTTVAAIIECDNKFLMVEENVEGKIQFNQPAGHLDPDESLIDACIRETQEETAWTFHPEHLVDIYLWKQPDTERTFLRFAMCGTCRDHKPEQQLDDGIIRALWMNVDELKEKENQLRSPLVLKCIKDYQSGIRQPLNTMSFVE